MYDYFCAFIVGVVEGLTEYIPVSSTGHMIIVGHMLGFEGTLADLFDVFIQLGAILSVLVVYREKFTFILNTHHWFRTKGPSLLNLAIAMFPACLLGLVFHGFIKNTLFGPMTVIIGLVLGGIFMIAAEKMHKHFSVTDVDHITWKQALKIGLFQCLSLWPGFSRSGSTIAGSLLLGISRKAAADFFESLLRRMRYFRRVEAPSEPLRLHEFHEIAFSFECHPPAFGCFFTEGRSTINLP